MSEKTRYKTRVIGRFRMLMRDLDTRPKSVLTLGCESVKRDPLEASFWMVTRLRFATG